MSRTVFGRGQSVEIPRGHSGSSYASQSDLALTFGLGKDTQVQSLEVLWPSGLKETVRNVRIDKANLVVEGSGTAVVK